MKVVLFELYGDTVALRYNSGHEPLTIKELEGLNDYILELIAHKKAMEPRRE